MAKHILTQKHVQILYYGLVHPCLLRGIKPWENTYHKYIKKLEVVKKRQLEPSQGHSTMIRLLNFSLNILQFKDSYQNANVEFPL